MAHSVNDLCIRHGWTAEALAQRCGLDHARVQAIVLGRWTPAPDERRRVAAAFDLTIDDIAWGHATPIQHLYGHGPG
jgi:transcriptional regulator with XRE-family HTH domain